MISGVPTDHFGMLQANALCKLVTLFIIYRHGPCISNFRGKNYHFPNILAYGTLYVLNNTYIETNSCQNKFFCNLSLVGVVLIFAPSLPYKKIYGVPLNYIGELRYWQFSNIPYMTE